MRKSRGIWVVEWFSGGEMLTKFFHYEVDARDLCKRLYDECLVVGDVFRDDFRVYSDLAEQGLL